MNKRFHHIEADLDTLAAQVARLATCMADMRAKLRTLLDEIAAELNRLDSDVGAVRGPRVIAPIDVRGFAPLGGGGMMVGPPMPEAPFTPPSLRGDPQIRFLGTTMFQNRAVTVFNTSQGIMMMPAVDASSPTSIDQRTSSAGALARAMVDNADLKGATAGAGTKQELGKKVGDLPMSNGHTPEQA